MAVPLGVGLLVPAARGRPHGSWAPVGVVALYVALQPAYTYWLKHVAVIDMIVVSAGFVLRAVAGVVGTEIPVSDWYLIVASFGSLFLVASKRSTELRLGDAAGGPPHVLDVYTPSFLLLVRGVAVSITLLAYCLWAFEKAAVADLWVPVVRAVDRALLGPAAPLHPRPRGVGAGRARGHRPGRPTPPGASGWCGSLCLAAGVYVAGAPPLPG